MRIWVFTFPVFIVSFWIKNIQVIQCNITICWHFLQLTIRMLVRQPVVLGILKFKIGVARLALLCAEILKMLWAVVCVAELVFVVHSWAVLSTVGGPLGREYTKMLRPSKSPEIDPKKKNGKTVQNSAQNMMFLSFQFQFVWEGAILQ